MIAELGLKIDSSPVNAATTALDKLAPAAATAEKSTKSLQQVMALLSQISTNTAATVAALEKSANTASVAIKKIDTSTIPAAKQLDVFASASLAVDKALQQTVADLNLHGVAVKNGTVPVKGLADAHAGMSTQA